MSLCVYSSIRINGFVLSPHLLSYSIFLNGKRKNTFIQRLWLVRLLTLHALVQIPRNWPFSFSYTVSWCCYYYQQRTRSFSLSIYIRRDNDSAMASLPYQLQQQILCLLRRNLLGRGGGVTCSSKAFSSVWILSLIYFFFFGCVCVSEMTRCLFFDDSARKIEEMERPSVSTWRTQETPT